MRKQIWKRLGWSITALEDKKKCFAWLFFFFVLQLILQYYYPMTSDDLYFRYGVEISNKMICLTMFYILEMEGIWETAVF